MTKIYICAICAQYGLTCCQLGKGKPKFIFPLSPAEKSTISALGQWTGHFSVKMQNSQKLVSRLYNLFPKDQGKIQALFHLDGPYERLLTDNQDNCIFLGSKGCLLSERTRPFYCRIFPFWVVDSKIALFRFQSCHAQKGVRTFNRIMTRFKINKSKIMSLYESLRKAWDVDC